ncbi:MAG TPA: hypothetical protein DIV79_03825 [Opitutae bacterium]|nr:hypothetical protein [Opitutaceae bacterium]HCR29127.1 hypothetical protein [Opitutae bacterium]
MKQLLTYTKSTIAFGLAYAAVSAVFGQGDAAYTLDPFTVQATEGYTATNTISGTGLSTPLSDVPMGINVITSDFLEDSHIGEFTHAMDYNASITQTGRNDNGNSVAATFAIRGYRNSTMLTDGVLGGMVLPMQMIDRIEVVKGPNTLYGQAEPSGLINVITKKPRAEEGGTIRGITGSNEWYQIKLDYTVRAMDDKLGLRIMTDNKETNGWRWLGNREYQFKGLSGSYELAETTDFDFLVAENHATGFPTQRATWSFERIPTDLNGDGDLDDTVGGVKESTARFNNTFLPPEYVSATADNTLDQQYYWMSMGIRHSFSENHNFQYKYNFNERDHLMSAREFNTFNPDGSNPVNNYSNEFISRDEVHTLADIIEFGTGDVKHQLLLGIRESESINNMGRGNYRLRARNATENAALRAIEARTGKRFRDVLYKSDITRGTAIWEDDAPTTEEIFAYGQRSNQAGRSFQEITTIYATDNIYFNNGQSNVIVGVRNINLDQRNEALGGATTSTLSGSDTNFQFGGVHRINPNLSVFASWADSFRPQNRTDPNTGELVGPQTSEAIEVGLKFADMYDGKLTGSVTAFRIEQNNVFRSDHNPVTFVNDQAITDDLSEGLEFELFINPVPHWNIVAAYSYIDAKVVGDVATGLPLEGATPHRFTLFNSYTIQEGPLAGVRFGGGLVYADGPIAQFGNTANRLVVEDGYTVYDLFARFPVTFGERDWTVGINIDNATNEFFVRSRAATNEARQALLSLSTEL